MNFLWPTTNANREAKANTFAHTHIGWERERGENNQRKREKTNYIFVKDMIFFAFLRKVHVKVEEFSSWLCKK